MGLLALQEWWWFIQCVPLIKGSSTTFVAESIALLAFGISWLVKGETLWKDAT
jgi:hypothetical protein